mgnify:FL=1
MNGVFLVRFFSLSSLCVLVSGFSAQGINAEEIEITDAEIRANNQILGAEYDRRSIDAIVKDMAQEQPLVASFRRWFNDKESSDLVGWNDKTMPEKISSAGAGCTQLKQQIASSNPDAKISARVKSIESIIGKLRLKKPRALDSLQDICVARIIVNKMSDMRTISKQINRKDYGPVLEFTDYVAEPKASGYRSVHFIQRIKDEEVEIQLRTVGMHVWGEWSHTLYKPAEVIAEVGEEAYNSFKEYGKKVSIYINEVENGRSAKMPVAPPKLSVLYGLVHDEEEKKYMLSNGQPNLGLMHQVTVD